MPRYATMLVRLLAGLLISTAVFGCAARQAGLPSTKPDVRRPRGKVLDALPSEATYAWVYPSDMYSRVLPEDEESMIEPEVVEMRDAVNVTLAGHRWREVPRDSAAFVLTVFIQRRLRTRVVNHPTAEPRAEVYLGAVCDPAVRDPRLGPCPQAARATRKREREQYLEQMAVFGLRRADGQGVYRTVPVFRRGTISKELVVLLLSAERAAPTR